MHGYRFFGEHQGFDSVDHLYEDATEAAHTYHRIKHELGIWRCGICSESSSFAMMGLAEFTAAGARNAISRSLAACLRRFGIQTLEEPAQPGMLDEFACVDC